MARGGNVDTAWDGRVDAAWPDAEQRGVVLVVLADEPPGPSRVGDTLVTGRPPVWPGGGALARRWGRWKWGALGLLVPLAVVASALRPSESGPVPTPAHAASTLTPPLTAGRAVRLPFRPSPAAGVLLDSGREVWSILDSRVTALRDGRVRRSVRVPGLIRAAGLSPDATTLWITALGSGPTTMRRYDANTLVETAVRPAPGPVYAVAVAGGRVFGGGSGVVYVTDARTGRAVRTIPVPGGGVVMSLLLEPGGGDILALIGDQHTAVTRLGVIDGQRRRFTRFSTTALNRSQSFATAGPTVWTDSAAAGPFPLTDLVGLDARTLARTSVLPAVAATTSVWAGDGSWWTYAPAAGRISCRDRSGRVAASIRFDVGPHTPAGITYPLVVAADTVYVQTPRGLLSFGVPAACG